MYSIGFFELNKVLCKVCWFIQSRKRFIVGWHWNRRFLRPTEAESGTSVVESSKLGQFFGTCFIEGSQLSLSMSVSSGFDEKVFFNPLNRFFQQTWKVTSSDWERNRRLNFSFYSLIVFLCGKTVCHPKDQLEGWKKNLERS